MDTNHKAGPKQPAQLFSRTGPPARSPVLPVAGTAPRPSAAPPFHRVAAPARPPTRALFSFSPSAQSASAMAPPHSAVFLRVLQRHPHRPPSPCSSTPSHRLPAPRSAALSLRRYHLASTHLTQFSRTGSRSLPPPTVLLSAE
jgi:hypothetical protein